MQQEKRISQILHPDRTLAYNSGDHKVGGLKPFTAGSAKSKDFYVHEKFRQKVFNSKDFRGEKSAWLGDAKFTTKSAKTDGKFKILNADKKVDTKLSPTKDAREASKTASTHEAHEASRQLVGPDSTKLGKFTTRDKENSWKGDMHQMTIDEVRDLLNKPKL